MAVDPVALAQALIRCPSVTPADQGALDVLATQLRDLGFTCTKLRFEAEGTPAIDNLYARLGSGDDLFCFAGHTDVVPTGKIDGWSVDPFAAEVSGGKLYGRGAADMKGAIACFVAAVDRLKAAHPDFAGSIGMIITGDEEGPAINGTVKVLDWMAEQGERMSACLVGEPTNPDAMGQMMKIGRRGSVTGYLTVTGIQGHVAYPDRADNPVPKLLLLLRALGSGPIDAGTEHFQASNLEITTVDVGNPATNVIPARAAATFNIRFNDLHTAASLQDSIRRKLDAVGIEYELRFQVSGEAFLTRDNRLSALVAGAVGRVTGRIPEASTSGGTSDARFIHKYCPVVEFGLVGHSMHKVDEHVDLADMAALTEIYLLVLEDYFGLTG
jgi:succinyl-diaminopimelate desuccinylase